MKILTLHCDYIKFKPLKKAIKNPEDLKEKGEIEVKEPLVVLTAVENGDSDKTVAQLLDAIKKTAAEVNAKNIVLYPYAHLSSNLANPDTALEYLVEAEQVLKKEGYNVTRAPFGYYKEFELKVKGHPLSELSKEFHPENLALSPKELSQKASQKEIELVNKKNKTQREIISEKIERKHYILTPTGKEFKIDVKDTNAVNDALDKIDNEELKTYVLFNEIKNVAGKEPPSIKEMQQQELVGYAPEADSGHFKFYPKGNLIFELLKDWAYEIAVNRFNCLQIETPIIYDWNDHEIREQGGSFHERHYVVKAADDPEKEWVLRFAGDFGLFKIMKHATLSYKNLPIRMYEFSKSFRYEQKGELSGLKRLRGFHMPDIHSFTKDLTSGWDEYKELYKQYDDLAKGIGVKYAIVFRIVEDFYKKHKDQLIEMLKYSKAPAFIETLSGMKHYWAVKHEFQGLDSVKGATQLSTVQLDVKDAETYGIVYTDKDNTKKGCTIVHSSVGSIERWIYCILEKALQEKKPSLPYWLSPTQVRICSVSEKFNDDAAKLAKFFNSNNIRADVDDNADTLSKKVSNAEKEWVPYIIVYGEKEKNSKNLPVRVRETGKIENWSNDEIIKNLSKKQTGMPWKPLPLSVLMSKRPIFV
jgi:threonyl-tRNA synthetase